MGGEELPKVPAGMAACEMEADMVEQVAHPPADLEQV
jgi:hypothetical protein